MVLRLISPHSHELANSLNSKVSCPFQNNTWKIPSSFRRIMPDVVLQIEKVVLPMDDCEDKLILEATLDGTFSIS